uniref:Uncharacterized protein n=1 Tax=Setaria viridis TaxID=4556 RepID=A0A4U6WEF1_SETVI|nr:hypothetical protein SEVIR_1G297900v2 [Setaria viridis]
MPEPASHHPPTEPSPTRPERQVPYTPRARPPRLCAASGRRERAGHLPLGSWGSWDFEGFCPRGFKSYSLVGGFLFLGNAGVSCCPDGRFVRFS